MLLPALHLNGTSREALHEGYMHALCALQDALRALETAAPNARDYYPLGPDAYQRAAQEHLARLTTLADVVSQLAMLAEHTA